MPDTRPITRLGDIVFERFPHPPLDVDGGTKTARHEPIGEPDVVDHMGREAKSFTLRGHCHPETATQIDALSKQSEHELRHSRWSGRVIVEDHNTESDGAFLDPEQGILRYTYRVSATEIVE